MTPPPAEKVAEPVKDDPSQSWRERFTKMPRDEFIKRLRYFAKMNPGYIGTSEAALFAADLLAAAPAPSGAQSEREALARLLFAADWPVDPVTGKGDTFDKHFSQRPGGDDAAKRYLNLADVAIQARASAGSATVDADTIAKQIVDEWAGLYCDDGSRLDPKWQEIAAIITAHTHSAPPALREAGATEGDIFAGYVCRDVAELPNRTSPEDAPDMMLVTADELTDIILRHLRRAG